MSMVTRSLDRIRGCILGGVIGDAFGAPLEGSSPAATASRVELLVRVVALTLSSQPSA
jgi:ADP-ribosylglycohydrolase